MEQLLNRTSSLTVWTALLDRVRAITDPTGHFKPLTGGQKMQLEFSKDRASAAYDESSERRDKLQLLRQDLDRLLRSPKADVSWPVS